MVGRAMNPLGAIWTTVLDSLGQPVGQINPLGYVSTTVFSAAQNKIASVDALGYRSTTVFDPANRTVVSVDALGNYSTVILDNDNRTVGRMNPLGAIWTTIMDANSRPIGQMNPLGYINSAVFDAASRQIAMVNPLGFRSTAIFDNASRQIASQNALGYLSTTVFDAADRTVASVDALGNRSTTLYDQASRAVGSIDPLGAIWTTAWDQASRRVASVDPGGFYQTTIFDPASRRIASLDTRGFLSTTIFDAASRSVASINSQNAVNTTVYNFNNDKVSYQDPLNRVWTSSMDVLGRTQAAISPLGYVTTSSWDAAGNPVSSQMANGAIWTSIFDSASRQVAQVSPLAFRSTTLYDAANQYIGSQNAMGYVHSSILDAAGRNIADVSPLGFVRTNIFDSASQPIASVRPLSGYAATTIFSPSGIVIGSQNELGYITSFIFDQASQRICVVDANNGRSTTVYSCRGYVLAEQDQLGAFTSYTQDGNGNNILRVDARNWPTTYTIDPLNRMSGALFIDGSHWTNTWDSAGQQITMQDVTGSTGYVWDLDSRKVATQNPTGINLTLTLDPLGNRLVLQDSFGITSYSWDAESRLANIWNPYNEITTMTWDPLSREPHRVLANGGTVSHTWDANGRETLIENRNAAGVGLAVFTNTYSANDNRLYVTELDGALVTYGYDASSQITSESRDGSYGYNRSYVWDPLGNRLQQWDSGVLTVGTFNATNELLVTSPAGGMPTTCSWAAAGNMLGSNTGGVLVTNTWDAENKLLTSVTSSGTESYMYAQDGLRREKANTSGTTLFMIDEQNVLMETTDDGVLIGRYTQSPKGYGGLASQNQSGTSSFHGFDSQLSSRILISIAGNVTDSYSYQLFGEELQGGSGTVNPHRYVGEQGYYRDAPNVMQVGQRKLHAAIGRWINRDPIGFDGSSWNLFRYVENSPAVLFDPSGLVPGFSPACSTNCIPGGPNTKCMTAFCNKVAQRTAAVNKCAKKFLPAGVLPKLSCLNNWCKSGNQVQCAQGPACGLNGAHVIEAHCPRCCNLPSCPCGCKVIPYNVPVSCAWSPGVVSAAPGHLGNIISNFPMTICCYWYNGDLKKDCPNDTKSNCPIKSYNCLWLHELTHQCSGFGNKYGGPVEKQINSFVDCVLGKVCGAGTYNCTA